MRNVNEDQWCGAEGSSSLGWLITAVAGAGLAAIVGFGALRLRGRQS